jgi:hypothetical protein
MEDLVSLVQDPITGDLMLDAVNTPTGRTYSLAVIKRIIQERGKDPFTNAPLRERDLVPNYPIRQAAAAYQSQQSSRGQSGSHTAPTDEKRVLESKMLAKWTKAGEVMVIDEVKKVAVHPDVVRAYNDGATKFGAEEYEEFHGTLEKHIEDIAKKGLKIPTSTEREDDKEGKLRFGKAIYTSSSLTKACSYGSNYVLVCKVRPGRVLTLKESKESLDASEMRQKQKDSVLSTFDGDEDPERAYYHPCQVLPLWVVKYHTVTHDGLDLPDVIPERDVVTLVRFLSSTDHHKTHALRFLGNCFRDSQLTAVCLVLEFECQFFSALTRCLRSVDEQMVLLALRVLWNSCFTNERMQLAVLTHIDAKDIVRHIKSKSESVQHRTAGVLVNLCHLARGNHVRLLQADEKLGESLANGSMQSYRKGNIILTTELLMCLANLLQGGARIVSQRQIQELSEFFDNDVPRPITDELSRVFSGFIFDGVPDPQHVERGFRVSVGLKGE